MSTTLDRNQRAYRKVVQKEIRETEKFHKRISTSYSSDLKQAGVPQKEIEICEKLLLRYNIDIASQMIDFFQSKKTKNTTIEDAEYNPLENTEVTPIDSSACERVAQKQKEQKENSLKLTEKQAFDGLVNCKPRIIYPDNLEELQKDPNVVAIEIEERFGNPIFAEELKQISDYIGKTCIDKNANKQVFNAR